MTKTLPVFFIILLFVSSFLFFVSKPAFADLINPDYFTSECNPGEIEVVCRYSRKNLSDPFMYDECKKYKNNPNYRYLTGHGSTFGGSSIYCLKPGLSATSIIYHGGNVISSILFTILLEIPVFLILGFRKRKSVFAVILANLISIPILFVFTTFLPISGFLWIAFLEFMVVLLEAIIIRMFVKDISFRKILVASIAANLVSAILGTILLRLFKGYWSALTS